MFEALTGNTWRIKFFGSAPMMHTVREFTDAEREDQLNADLKGVRTFFFGAHHWRGVPELLASPDGATDYCDWAWVPKRQFNEFFTKEYYDVFVNVCKTR